MLKYIRDWAHREPVYAGQVVALGVAGLTALTTQVFDADFGVEITTIIYAALSILGVKVSRNKVDGPVRAKLKDEANLAVRDELRKAEQEVNLQGDLVKMKNLSIQGTDKMLARSAGLLDRAIHEDGDPSPLLTEISMFLTEYKNYPKST